MTAPEDLDDLQRLIDFLRMNRVAAFAWGGLSMTLAEQAVEFEPGEDEAPPPVAEPAKRGKDGLTRAEQMDLYGHALED